METRHMKREKEEGGVSREQGVPTSEKETGTYHRRADGEHVIIATRGVVHCNERRG